VGCARARIAAAAKSAADTERNDERRAQVGSGQRGDKRRTIRFKDDVTTDT